MGTSVKKKRRDFFQGEVFFLLTRPLMGDPLCLYENMGAAVSFLATFGRELWHEARGVDMLGVPDVPYRIFVSV